MAGGWGWGRGCGGSLAHKHLISPCGTRDQRSANVGRGGGNAKSRTAPSPKRPRNPEEEPVPTRPSQLPTSTPRGLPRKLGCSGEDRSPQAPGVGCVWNGARGSKDTLPRVSLSSSSKVRTVAGSGGEGAKCGRSHLETVSSAGTPVRSRNRPGTGLGGGKRRTPAGGWWTESN